MRIRALALSLLVPLLATACCAQALAAEVTASAGAVTARLASGGGRFAPGPTVLTVTRGAVTNRFPGLEGKFGYRADKNFPLVIRDLDGDGEPEVLAQIYSGGAHCCFRSVIASWDPAAGGYVVSVHDWLDASWRLRDLNGDGRPELASFDARWSYWGGEGFAGSPAPIQIWSFRGGSLVDVTRDFPALVTRDRAAQLRYLKVARRAGARGRGPLAAYLADSYLLGRQRAGWIRVYREFADPGRLRFFRALRSELTRLGYRPAGDPVPRVVPARRRR